MTARGSLAIAALAFQATILPLPALAQTDYVPSAVGPGPTSGPLISRQTAALAGLLFAGALLGDRQFREESQEHRDATSNSVASVGNTFGDYKMLIPVLSAGYLAGQIAGSREIKGTVLRAGAAVALATGITTGLKYSFGRSRPDVGGTNIQFRPFSGSTSFPSGHTAAAFALGGQPVRRAGERDHGRQRGAAASGGADVSRGSENAKGAGAGAAAGALCVLPRAR